MVGGGRVLVVDGSADGDGLQITKLVNLLIKISIFRDIIMKLYLRRLKYLPNLLQ